MLCIIIYSRLLCCGQWSGFINSIIPLTPEWHVALWHYQGKRQQEFGLAPSQYCRNTFACVIHSWSLHIKHFIPHMAHLTEYMRRRRKDHFPRYKEPDKAATFLEFPFRSHTEVKHCYLMAIGTDRSSSSSLSSVSSPLPLPPPLPAPHPLPHLCCHLFHTWSSFITDFGQPLWLDRVSCQYRTAVFADVIAVASECVNGSLVIQKESSGCPSCSVAVAGRLRNASACFCFVLEWGPDLSLLGGATDTQELLWSSWIHPLLAFVPSACW